MNHGLEPRRNICWAILVVCGPSDGSGSDFPGIEQVRYFIFLNFRVSSGSGISFFSPGGSDIWLQIFGQVMGNFYHSLVSKLHNLVFAGAQWVRSEKKMPLSFWVFSILKSEKCIFLRRGFLCYWLISVKIMKSIHCYYAQ